MENFDLSMYDYLIDRTSCLKDSNKMINFYGRTINRKKFILEVDRIASYLQSIGIKKGDNVVVCLGNIPNAIISFYAINKVGAIANVLHPLVKDETLRQIYKEHKPKCFIMFDEFFKSYTLFKEIKTNVIVCSALDYLPALYKPFYGAYIMPSIINIKYTDKIVKYSKIKGEHLTKVNVNGDDIAIYMHSSGTTGNSKTACQTNAAYNHLAENLTNAAYHQKIGGDKYGMLMALPIFHVFGLGVCMHTTLCYGAQTILMPKFSARYGVYLMMFRPVTMISGVPNMYKKLAANPLFNGPWLKKLVDCFCGGDKLEDSVKQSFEKPLRKWGNQMKIAQGYGSTEAGVVMINLQNNQVDGSIGVPLEGTEIKILDENKKELGINEVGTIYLKSNTMMKSYYDKSLNEGVLEEINGEIWLNTQDMGYIDETGHVFFKERQKRLIKISGINVFPNEIEEVVNSIDEIKLSCAIQGEMNGKRIVELYIQLKEGITYSKDIEQKIKDLISKKLLKYSMPSRIIVLDKLPLTELGKVDYKNIH